MKFLAILLLSLSATAAIAAPPTRESIETLLAETRIERSIDGMMDNMNRLMQQNVERLMHPQMTAAQQDALRATQDKMTALLRSEMTYEKLKPIYIDVYQQTYTQEEVDGLIAFYRTPVGQSYIDKMPLALQRSIVAMQPLMQDMMRKSMAIGQQAAEAANTSKP